MSFVTFFAQANTAAENLEGVKLTPEQAASIMLTLTVIMLIVSLVVYVVVALSLGRIFKKAGVDGRKAWVPIYNLWILLQMGHQRGYWALLALVPGFNLITAIFMIIAMYHIGKRFGKSDKFVLVAIFLPLVWYIWLAVDNSTWKGKKPTIRAQSA